MKRNHILILTVASAICLLAVLLPQLETRSKAQMSDTCTDGKLFVLDVVNKRYKCLLPDTTLIYRAKSLNVNQTNTDIGSFTSLPSRYIVRRLTFDNCSATPTLSTVSLRTATAGGGTAIVTAQALSTLTATTTFVDSTLAVTTTAQTSATLTLRAVAAAGGASTCDSTLEITPLN